MQSKSRRWMLAAAGVAVVAAAAWGIGQGTKELVEQPAQAKGRAVKSDKTRSATPKKIVAVSELAAKPSAHLGRVAVAGVVATATPGKGFLLLDSVEYKKCALTCLNEPGNKIPVRWSGAAPKVEQTMRVDGVLAKTVKGFVFTAHKVARP